MPGIPPSHRAPAPPDLSEDDLKGLTPCQLNTMARTVNLESSKSLKMYRMFLTPNGRTFKKPPNHILGGYRCWRHVLNAICLYNELSDKQRVLESQKSRRMAPAERERLHRNMQELMENRPEKLPFASEDRCSTPLKEMIARAAAQSAKTLAKKEKEGIFEKCHHRKRKAEACPVCGFVSSQKILRTVHSSVPTDPNACSQCVQMSKQHWKQARKDSSLTETYRSQLSCPPHCNQGKTSIEVNLAEFLAEEFDNEASKELLKCLGKSIVKVELRDTVPLFETSTFNKKSLAIAGAQWDMTQPDLHPNVIKLEDSSVDVVFLRLRRSSAKNLSLENFAILINNNFDPADVAKFSRDEMLAINAKSTGHRPGTASGVYQIGDQCHNFTPVTQKSTTFYQASGDNAVHARAVYINAEGIVKTCNNGYRAMSINRLKTEQKKRQAERCLHYRRILLREAIAYIIGVACLRAIEIPPASRNGRYFNKLREIVLTRDASSVSVEDCLCQWMCSTGEIRNHEACKCHVDGNTSHHYEILSLFSRANKPSTDGYLYLPLDNLVIEIKCNVQSLLCNFHNTPHVADSSRNTLNFSKVHGPKP